MKIRIPSHTRHPYYFGATLWKAFSSETGWLQFGDSWQSYLLSNSYLLLLWAVKRAAQSNPSVVAVVVTNAIHHHLFTPLSCCGPMTCSGQWNVSWSNMGLSDKCIKSQCGICQNLFCHHSLFAMTTRNDLDGSCPSRLDSEGKDDEKQSQGRTCCLNPLRFQAVAEW